MIDTVGFYVMISKEDFEKLYCEGVMTQRIDKSTGFVEFEYTNFEVSHSYNYRVQWRMDDKYYVKDHKTKVMVEERGIPYLRFEFSIPKILNGHNLVSVGTEGLIDACALVRLGFEKMTGVSLVGPGEWYPYRVDSCANFLFDSITTVKSYIRYLQRLDYPRRLGNIYKDTGIYFASRHNTLKLYCKGEEFKKHDAPRFIDELERQRLQDLANKMLRIEVENKRRLKYVIEKHEKEFGETFNKFKGFVNLEDLLYIMDFKKQTEHVMKKFMVGKTTRVMRSLQVFDILKDVYGERQGRTFHSVYMLLVTQGQMETKRRVKKSTYYDAIKAFRENEISILVSDIKPDIDFKEVSEFEYLLGLGFPSDFSFEMSESNKYYQMPIAA